MARLSISRRVSYDVLVEVLSHEKDPAACLSLAFESASTPIKRVDRNLAYEIVYGTLRTWTKLNWIVQNYSHRDLEHCSMVVRVSLVAGSYQIFYLNRIPDRASVNESVEYVRARDQKSAVPFVNGILRQVAQRARYFAKPDMDSEPVEFLSLQFSTPSWLVRRWLERFGFKKLESMLRTSNSRPPITIRLHSGAVKELGLKNIQRRLLKEEKTRLDKRPLHHAFHLVDPPQLGEGSIFSEGLYTIQDESSQLIAHLVNPQLGEFIVDGCAGPGGKLTHIYELAALKAAEEKTASQGPQLWAFEKKDDAFERMMSNLKRLGCHGVMGFKQDFLTYKPTERAPDKILLDVPCSGLGVLRRHPEGKLFKKPSLIAHMAERQREFLQHGLDILALGGELIYSVCSFEPEETLHHLDWIEENFARTVEVMPLADRLQGYYKRYLTKRHMLWVYAGNSDAMDGFGAFVLKKIS